MTKHLDGMLFERQRIIKALENATIKTNETTTKDFEAGVTWAIKETIALIEKDKK